MDELPEGARLLEDGSIEFDDDVVTVQNSAPSNNIVSEIDADDLKSIASRLVELVAADEESRKPWKDQYEKGLKSVSAEEEPERRGLSKVTHPLIVEAAVQFNAKALGELIPADGPADTTVIGEVTPQKVSQAERVRDYLNYQTMYEMTEFFDDTDRMLFHLPLVGHTFKKVWNDSNLQRVTSQFVKAEDFVMHYGTKDLQTSARYTHKLSFNRPEFQKLVNSGFYEDIPDIPADTSDKTPSNIDTEPSSILEDSMVYLLEVYASIDIPGIDDDAPIDPPYIITIHEETNTVLSVRRNWKDENYTKRVYFVSYRFLPGLGAYGFGLYHAIGGLGKAATGALRALLDSAAFSNLQGGLKLKGRTEAGTIEIAPGEFADIDVVIDDISKAVMPLPFKEPSQTLFALLGFMVDAGQRFASTTEIGIGDANNNAPVGTTLALIEQGSRVFSAIHKRLHNSQKQELGLIAELNGESLPERYPYEVKGQEKTILRRDFDDRVDVVPVSDPNIFSTSQRIAQSQTILQLAQADPQMHNMRKVYERAYSSMRIPNWEELLAPVLEPKLLDPVTENVLVFKNQAIAAFPEQDHRAHIAVHMQFLQDPNFGGNPQAAQMVGPALTAHIADHLAYEYKNRVQAQLGGPLPTGPDPRDPEAVKSLPIQTEIMISQAAAQAVHSRPLGPVIPGIGDVPPPADPVSVAMEVARAEAEGEKLKTQARMESDSAKAKQQMELKEAETINELKEQKLRFTHDAEIEKRKHENQMELLREKHNFEMFSLNEKLKAELEVLRKKGDLDLEIKEVKSAQELHIKHRKENPDPQPDPREAVVEVAVEIFKQLDEYGDELRNLLQSEKEFVYDENGRLVGTAGPNPKEVVYNDFGVPIKIRKKEDG